MATTPGYYMFTATEASILDLNAPTAPAIVSTLGAVRLYYSAWVGPKPRITRSLVSGALRANLTHVAWLVSSTTTLASLQTYSTGSESTLMQALGRLGNWSDIRFTPYDPDVNGTVGWWQSGAAYSTSLTIDSFPTGLARFNAPDNPVGPTTRADHPTTILEGLGDAAHNAGGAAAAAAWEAEKAALTVGAVAAVVVFGPTVIPPLLAWLRKRFPTEPAPKRR